MEEEVACEVSFLETIEDHTDGGSVIRKVSIFVQKISPLTRYFDAAYR
jgi:hypothetical protein